MALTTEDELLAYAAALGASDVGEISGPEVELLRTAPRAPAADVLAVRRRIRRGEDPLGAAFTAIRSPLQRRSSGATYTPQAIVAAMVHWAATHIEPERVVDPGVGSGRFLLEAGRVLPSAKLLGVEIDPLAALLARANLAASGFANRAQILLADYRSLTLSPIEGRTLFIGNPPYVRHHLINATWKDWLVREARKIGLTASQLAGLHVHFFLATQLLGRDGDFGALITASEWLDVNYGRLVRELFLGGLGGDGIIVVEPTARPFPDAATTAAIATFEVGSRPSSIRLHKVEGPEDFDGAFQSGGVRVRRERLAAATRWTHFFRTARPAPEGFVELGELCRVHRGQVTGANKVWIAGAYKEPLPSSVLFPTVTKARELFRANGILADATQLRRVIDLPVNLDELENDEQSAVERFLAWARSLGAHEGYIARHRRAWYSVGLREPPPIMATYMARRPPAFVQNQASARYINIAHGIYPREPLSALALRNLALHLARVASDARGRTYAGGLMKFEPREMERMLVPMPQQLEVAGA